MHRPPVNSSLAVEVAFACTEVPGTVLIARTSTVTDPRTASTVNPVSSEPLREA
jgi:hypothetical protein